MSAGPYETERETRGEPMPKAVSALHDAGTVKSGDPDRVVRGTKEAALLQACEAAGVELGAHDRGVIAWLSEWETSTVQAVIGLITRAGAAGADRPAGDTYQRARTALAEAQTAVAIWADEVREAAKTRAGVIGDPVRDPDAVLEDPEYSQAMNVFGPLSQAAERLQAVRTAPEG
ncbi:hypothetical protein [Planomonospora sp. ID82291]|uniref:hypothetical protein n=1 Tax=Planomonospora sp. ID82291 TaxID=2738136 RepID=UPI0018C37A46|nr:hypothetical protein [Planomonospora sp. ID82291]MBG0819108.1 hypothetical protein [Planomonospora sp. ID82291]